MEPLLGQIQLFPYGFAPIGWALCNGVLLSIPQNQALFSLINTKFGGDGRNTFGIPNLLNASPVQGMDYYIATQGIYPSRG